MKVLQGCPTTQRTPPVKKGGRLGVKVHNDSHAVVGANIVKLTPLQ